MSCRERAADFTRRSLLEGAPRWMNAADSGADHYKGQQKRLSVGVAVQVIHVRTKRTPMNCFASLATNTCKVFRLRYMETLAECTDGDEDE